MTFYPLSFQINSALWCDQNIVSSWSLRILTNFLILHVFVIPFAKQTTDQSKTDRCLQDTVV